MKTIERIFDSAKNIDTPEFPFSDEELRSVLRKENEAGESRPKNNIFKKLGAFKMSLISLAIVGTSLGVLFLSQPNENNSLTEKKQINAKKVERQAKITERTNLAALKAGSTETDKRPVKQDINQPASYAKNERADKRVIEAEEYNYEAELYELTDEELAKLNVLRRGDAYLIELEDKIYHKMSMTERAELNDNGYPEKGIKRHVDLLEPFGSYSSSSAMRKYAGWDMDKTAGMFPTTIMSQSYDGDRLGISRTQGGIPAFAPDLEEAVSEQHFDDIGRKLLAAKRNDASTRFVKVKVNDPEIVSKFFPVYISMKNAEGQKAHILLWFPATSRTIAALPEHYRAKAQGKLLLQDEDLSKNLCENEFLRNNPDITFAEKKERENEPAFQPKQFAGIANIELTPAELKELGIALDKEGLSFPIRDRIDFSELPTRAKTYFADLGYDMSKTQTQIRGAFRMNFAAVRNGDIDGLVGRGEVNKYTGWNDNDWSLSLPIGIDYKANVMIATVNGKDTADRHIYTTTNSELFYNPKIINITGEQNPVDITNDYKLMPKVSRLLPIAVVYKFDENNNSGTIKVNLWFYMTKELAEKLPMRYGIPILRELELAEAIENGANPESACGELDNKTSYLGICNLQNGGIKIQSIYPNPVKEGRINLGFELAKPSKLTISLADYNGSVKEVIVDGKDYYAGSIAIGLPLKTQESGVYLLIISDENGATAMERIIIK